jgi:Hydrazine synthase alpha subunit middle domain
MAIGSSGIFFSSCKGKSMDGMIIITRAAGKEQNLNYVTGDSWRYIHQAQIVALDPDKPGSAVKVLTADYYSARSPEISYDGKYMLFAAQQKQNDPWQIWEMNLQDLKARQVTSSKENCIDPAYLPGRRLVFSKLTVSDSLKTGHSLYNCNLNGSDIRRITFNPHTYFASSVLKDGRVLTISRQLYPDHGYPEFMILRPDGTKSEMFYKGIEGSTLSSCGWETINGKIVFIESDTSRKEGGDIISINYNRPLHSRVNLTSETKGDFHAVFPLQSGRLLVSYRPTEADRYALYEFDPENKVLGQAVYNNTEYDALEVVVVGKHDRSKKLPSEVDVGVKTGLLLCQDINVLNTLPAGIAYAFPKASKIEVLGIDSALGEVQVEEDGSIYLKVMADKPFQIQTIDKNGHVLHGPCGWIWLRPNERRGCVGCHEDPEMVPGNRIPLAVKKSPINIPVHINKVVEKKVSLE